MIKHLKYENHILLLLHLPSGKTVWFQIKKIIRIVSKNHYFRHDISFNLHVSTDSSSLEDKSIISCTIFLSSTIEFDNYFLKMSKKVSEIFQTTHQFFFLTSEHW